MFCPFDGSLMIDRGTYSISHRPKLTETHYQCVGGCEDPHWVEVVDTAEKSETPYQLVVTDEKYPDEEEKIHVS